MAGTGVRAVVNMGPGTLDVPMSLFANNRSRVVDKLQVEPSTPSSGVIFLVGGDSVPLYNTDVDYLFRQEPFFQWSFGVREPGCFGAIQLSTKTSVLFMPRLPDSYAVWMGHLSTPNEFKAKYAVDRVHYVDEIKDVLLELCGAEKTLLALSGVNTDSSLPMPGVKFSGVEEFNLNYDVLWPAITECRVLKTPSEVEMIRYANKVSSEAHRLVMRAARPGLMEYQCEAVFLWHCYYVGGCRNVSYTCICGSGNNGSVLHYGHAAAPNDKLIGPNDMCLFDMGCNYYGYASDITCSFPASGKFTADQKMVYNAVLAARNRVIELAKPGVSWRDMHEVAYVTMLGKLRDGGLLKGDVNEMVAANLGAVFQPHGLGHFMGLDVHDVGGYPNNGPPRPTQPGFSSLRTARILEAGMVLTVEPGCYFIDMLLDQALANPDQSKFIVTEELARFRGFGGVRIEDDVLITASGAENLTTVPRTVEEIEEWMAGRGPENDLKDAAQFNSVSKALRLRHEL